MRLGLVYFECHLLLDIGGVFESLPSELERRLVQDFALGKVVIDTHELPGLYGGCDDRPGTHFIEDRHVRQ